MKLVVLALGVGAAPAAAAALQAQLVETSDPMAHASAASHDESPAPLPAAWGAAGAPPLLTLSVVLPCAFEGPYMERTARSVFAATPERVLKEIIIVDDASVPPLEPLFADAARFKVRFLKHESAQGLIASKSTGANAAVGDIIVFFDCHVKPATGYWEPFVRAVAANYRRVVMPTITNLNIDTWTEFGRPTTRGGGMSRCYLTFDAEFKWFDESKNPWVPVMSGGLLAISRRWWQETGGYDPEMPGWGGENLDQSLRIWRCGGEIVSAPDSFVAHMWRLPGDKRTQARYTVPPGAVATNRARAAKAHFGPWFEKTLTFPRLSGKAALNVSTIQTALSSKALQCQPFEWYLRRFAYIYRDAGVLPARIFQIEAVGTGLCLELAGHKEWGNSDAPSDALKLAACEEASPHTAGRTTMQWWHRSNRKADGTCCSGLRSWNTDQCLESRGAGSAAETGTCQIGADGQKAELTPNGQLRVGSAELCVEPSASIFNGIGKRQRPVLRDCAASGAGKWRVRGAQEPMEFAALSDAAKKEWISAGAMSPVSVA